MLKVVIGTASGYKIRLIKKVLYELDQEFEAHAVEVSSGISEQPMKIGETKQGSINRAQNALASSPESDLAIGLEFGYEPIDSKFHMVTWATIVSSSGQIFSEQSSTLELPKSLEEILLKDGEIFENLQELKSSLNDNNNLHTAFWRYIKKRQFLYEATLAVFVRALMDEYYK